MRYCTSCGKEVGTTNFCANCGAATGATADVRSSNVVAQFQHSAVEATATATAERIKVQQNLSAFRSVQQNVTCPNCGYHGPVGFIRIVKPLYANCFVLALLFITVVGILVILLLAILGKMRGAVQVQCPRCGYQFENHT